MSKRYEIKHITDIFGVPEDRWDDFVTDLKAYHSMGQSMPELFEEVAKLSGFEVESKMGSFTWVDDGKHDAKIIIVPVIGDKNA